MSKGKKKRSGSVNVAPEVDAPEVDAPSCITKTQKRKLQKKRQKLAAQAAKEAEACARRERKASQAQAAAAAASVPHPIPQPLAFSAAEDDHCETAPEAYAHIAVLLRAEASACGLEPTELRVYDPYYCNGAVVRHLAALGFPRVHNRNEDFYAVAEAGAMPPHDVVVTNPPYSGDHPERLLNFLVQNGKPWVALMPSYICDKEYFDPILRDSCFYVVPHKRYNYWTPRGRRADVASGGAKAKTHGHTNAALGIRTSPFVSFWYCGGFRSAVGFLDGQLEPPVGCRICQHKSKLPPGMRDGA